MPVLAGLSLSASIAETLVIGLVVLFLYAAIGPGAEAAGAGGVLLRVYEVASAVAGEGAVALAVLVLACVTFKSLMKIGYDLLAAVVKNAISERVRNAIYARYLHMPYGELRRHDQGDLVNLLATESWEVAEAFHYLARMGTNLAAFAVFGAVLVAVSWQVALLAACGAVLGIAALRSFSGPMRRLGRVAMKANEALAAQMVNTLHGMRTIRAYCQEPARESRFHTSSRQVRRAMVKVDQIHGAAAPVGELVLLAVLAAVVWLSTNWGVPFASVLAGIALLYRLQPHMRELESSRLNLARIAAPLDAVWRMIGPAGTPSIPRRVLPFAGLRHEIRFRHVSITYPGSERPSLSDASFVIPHGLKTAILGASGAGKSTVVNLLLRLYEPTEGWVEVDGRSLRDLDRLSWLSRVAVAGQDADLIEDTIANNIALALPEASPSEIHHAASLACVLEFAAGLPDGLDSAVGEQGLSLSGGQRQRIGIARALLRRPDILILDEASSELDAALERRIRANVEAEMAGRTLVIITHHLHSVVDAGHVIHLQDGRVLREGPADEVPLGALASSGGAPGAADRPLRHHAAWGDENASSL